MSGFCCSIICVGLIPVMLVTLQAALMLNP